MSRGISALKCGVGLAVFAVLSYLVLGLIFPNFVPMLKGARHDVNAEMGKNISNDALVAQAEQDIAVIENHVADYHVAITEVEQERLQHEQILMSGEERLKLERAILVKAVKVDEEWDAGTKTVQVGDQQLSREDVQRKIKEKHASCANLERQAQMETEVLRRLRMTIARHHETLAQIHGRLTTLKSRLVQVNHELRAQEVLNRIAALDRSLASKSDIKFGNSLGILENRLAKERATADLISNSPDVSSRDDRVWLAELKVKDPAIDAARKYVEKFSGGGDKIEAPKTVEEKPLAPVAQSGGK